MNYVYLKTERRLWTVGFYDPQGKWVPESDHLSTEAAAKRVNYLNGGTNEDAINAAALYIGDRS